VYRSGLPRTQYPRSVMGKLKDKAMGLLGIGGVMAFGMMISSNPAMKAKAVSFTTFMRANPIQGVLLHATVSTAITVSGVPFSLVDLGAAWVYPLPVAMGMLLFAKTLGSTLCFFIAKRGLPESRKQSILSHPTVARVNRVLAQSPIYYGTLFRLALVPAFVKNYGLALLDIDFRKYITCCLLGSCLGVPAQAHLGSNLGDIYLGLRDVNEVAQADPMMVLGGMAPALAMLILMPTVAKILLGKDEEEGQNGEDNGSDKKKQ